MVQQALINWQRKAYDDPAQFATTDSVANGGRGLHLALTLLKHAAHHFLYFLSSQVFGCFG
jgi:hypothetical protein